MKFVRELTEAERQTLWDAARYAPWARFRQRAHAVYLSGKGYCLDQLVDIFTVDRDTVSNWSNAWESSGLLGLRDQIHPGRPRKGTAEARDQIAGKWKRRRIRPRRCFPASRSGQPSALRLAH